ncbi:MAG: phosphatase PAP2 family protein [Planctomycetes bacterium]|nr:phosphatase PAP2 family protein [Planctomycetota bacterium]
MGMLWPVDRLNLAFLAFEAVLQLTRLRSTSGGVWWLAFDLASILLVLLLARATRTSTLRRGAVVRLAHGMVTVPLAFTQVGLQIAAVAGHDYAGELAAADRWMFGGTDPLQWLEGCAHPWLTEVLQISYTLYLLLPVAVVLMLALRADALVIARSIFSLLGIYYLSYIGYHLVPASGPNIHNNFGPLVNCEITPVLRHLFTDPLDGVWLTETLRQFIFNAEMTKQDCFPSGHVAVAAACMVYAFRCGRRVGLLFLPLCVGVIFSTVYLRYHYVVDLLAGLLLTFLGITVLEAWHRRMEPRNPAA